ncbi:MAG: carboxypeptidase regulatory-like domain-containing protein, partial [Pyrinomonadaceae bacterium]|nr:carboxypeptidase regulatory-like domain-containing protein [Pyrinomonadaceae bacterium]
MRFIYTLILLFTISSGVYAQNESGGLQGQVVDAAAAVIVGANVTVTNNAGIEKTATSDNSGDFTVTGLPAGKYTVRAVAPDFGVYENTEVEITAGKRESLSITLTVVLAEEQVNVTNEGRVTTDSDNNQSALVLKGADLASLPEDPDDLQAALQALAGPAAGPNGGQFFIDGFTGGRVPPRESIREIRINQNPFSAEFDRVGFGRIEILTKPGFDRLRGQVFGIFNNQSLNSRNPFAANRAPSRTTQYGGNLSGPIKKNKSSFFLDFERRDIGENAIVNATILDASLNPVLLNQAYLTPQTRTTFSPRIDYAINDKNTIIGRYTYTRGTSDNQNIGGFSLLSRATNAENTEQTFQLTETAILTTTIVNETRFQYIRNRNNQIGDNSIPTVQVSDSFTGGGSQIGFNFNNSDRFELQNNTTISAGKHAIRFGGRLRTVRINDQSQTNYGGIFTFSGAGSALRSIDQFRQRVLDDANDPNVDNAAFSPNQYTIVTGDPLASVTQYDFGGYILDDWRIRPNFTLSYGLRYEIQNNISDKMNFAPRLNFAYSPGAGGARQPKTVIRGGVGVFYDRFGENFTLQAQRFDGTRQLSLIVSDRDGSNAAARTLLQQAVFTNGGVTNAPTAAQVLAALPQSNIIRQVSNDLNSPYNIQFQGEVERQLPFGTVTLSYLNSRGVNLLRTRNINAPICPPLQVCNTSLRPNLAQGNIYSYESTGFSRQNEFRVRFNTRLNPRYTIFGFYRLGLTKSDTDGTGFPAYSYDLSNEYSNSSADTRHFAVFGGSISLPYNIRLNPLVFANSGRPFNITTGIDSNGDTIFNDRPTFAALNSRCQQLGFTNAFCSLDNVSNVNTIIPRNYGRGPAH